MVGVIVENKLETTIEVPYQSFKLVNQPRKDPDFWFPKMCGPLVYPRDVFFFASYVRPTLLSVS